MSARAWSVIGLLLGALFLPAMASAQPAPPISATLFFENPPAGAIFDGATPIKINLVVKNVSGTPIITIDGFSATDFWRLLYFTLDDVGIIANTTAGVSHGFTPYGTCHYRNSVLLPGAGIPVVGVEVLPADFGQQFSFDDAALHFDLSRDGRYSVTARISFLAYDAGAIINDCDIEFGTKSLLSIDEIREIGGRQTFEIVSNTLEFTIRRPDAVPPTTAVTASPAPNSAGWSSQDTTLDLAAEDNAGGSGVKSIAMSFFGAQADPPRTVAGATAAVAITAEGITTVFFSAEDNAGNKEPTRSETVRVDKTAPVVTPPSSITVTATEAGGARGSASPALAALLAGGTATDNLDPSPTRLSPQTNGTDVNSNTLFPVGTTTIAFRFQDVAGNTGTANSSVAVLAATGQPAISGSVASVGRVNPTIGSYDLKFTNTGTGTARNVVLSRFSFKTLAGKGTVSYDTTRSPALPISLGDLAAGASRTVRVFLAAPPPVKQFSVTESGQFQDDTGATFSFSTTEVVTR